MLTESRICWKQYTTLKLRFAGGIINLSFAIATNQIQQFGLNSYGC